MKHVHENAWFAPLIAAAAFALLAGVFARELVSFRTATADWAARDLAARAALEGTALREPLETSDLRRVREIASACEADGLRLTIFSPGGGVFFDSRRADEKGFLFAHASVGGHEVRLGLPEGRVFAPFNRARFGFLLAALAGAAAVAIVFLAFYRQRIRIRELARVEAFRRAFIADFSHELKTPLTGILGATDMLADAPESARATLVGMIRRESTRLNDLAQGVLDLARLERDDVPLRRERTNLAELVAETCDRFAPQSAAVGVRIENATVSKATVMAECDPQLVASALSNLVGNALRHSQSKEILVSASSGQGKSVLCVEDHGIGIPESERERVFERFRRLDPARAAETGGAGLGLAIVRRVAKIHGGEVRLEGVKPHGCRFVFSF